jgi:hypothetical protein
MRYSIAFITLALIAGCSNKERDRYYWQHDPSSSFKTTRTYALEQNFEPSLGANLRQAIDQEIQKQMSAKGLTRAEPGRQADIVIRYFGDQEHTAMMGAPPPAMREVGRERAPAPSILIPLDPSSSHNRPPEHAPGRLVIEILDPRTGKTLWRASAENTLSDPVVPDRLSQTVATLLKNFPPQAG